MTQDLEYYFKINVAILDSINLLKFVKRKIDYFSWFCVDDSCHSGTFGSLERIKTK